MKIRLLVDYRGVLTDEEYFTAGEYNVGPGYPISEAWAKALIADGRAEEIKTARPVSQDPEPEKPAQKRRVVKRRK